MTTDFKAQVSGLAEKPTVQLASPHRAIGRNVKIGLNSEPDGQPFSDLASDLFFSQFIADPQPVADVPEDRFVNRKLLDWMQESHGWRKGKANTTANLPASLAATSVMYEHITKDENIKKALEEQKKADEKRREAEQKQQAGEAIQQAARASGNSVMQAQAEQLLAEAAGADAQAQAAAQAAAELIDEAKSKPLTDAGMAAAARQAAEEAKDMAESMAGWGMGPGAAEYDDPSAAMAFMQQMDRKLLEIARLAGRMRGFALQARRERSPVGIIPQKVGETREVRYIFPQELAMITDMAPEPVRAEYVSRFVSTGLLGYQPQAEREKEGPFVGAVDVSGSMMGGREIVAKGVALGLAQAALTDGREFILFSFSDQRETIIEARSSDGWPALVKWATSTQHGGTSFDAALLKAMDDLEGLGDRADLMFISDGEARVSYGVKLQFGQFREATGTRLFYVPVARGYADIEDLADRVIQLDELSEKAGTELTHQAAQWMY